MKMELKFIKIIANFKYRQNDVDCIQVCFWADVDGPTKWKAGGKRGFLQSLAKNNISSDGR